MTPDERIAQWSQQAYAEAPHFDGDYSAFCKWERELAAIVRAAENDALERAALGVAEHHGVFPGIRSVLMECIRDLKHPEGK